MKPLVEQILRLELRLSSGSSPERAAPADPNVDTIAGGNSPPTWTDP